jgi:hypothetical protein
MADAEWPGMGMFDLCNGGFKISDLACAAMELEGASGCENRNASGIVTTILELAEAIEQYSSNIGPLRADVTNDTAHGGYPFSLEVRRDAVMK